MLVDPEVGPVVTNVPRDRGAAIVEMAMVAPFLVLLLLGIVEFGWKFAETTEIRHAARDAARFAAVSAPDLTGDGTFSSADISAAACDALALAGSGRVTITLSGGTDIGDTAIIRLDVATQSLSGAPIITSFLPTTISNEATFRLEQAAGWAPTTLSGQC
jgi:Flp pilus assembly protein TadG